MPKKKATISRSLKNKVTLLILAIIGLSVIIGLQQIQDVGYYSLFSQASDDSDSQRPRICDKCDEGGGVEYCKNLFDQKYQEYRALKPQWSEETVLNKAFSEMDKDIQETTQYDEEKCGYCDLYPQKSKKKFGDRIVESRDMYAYANLCIHTEITPYPTNNPPNCSRCDFDGDNRTSESDAFKIADCLFSTCTNADINNDGKIDATDASVASLCLNDASFSENCSYVDRNLNGTITAEEVLQQSRCPFNPLSLTCSDRDANQDGKVDAGDISWCVLHCSNTN